MSLQTVPKGRAREWPCLPPRGRNPVALPTQERCVNEQGFSLHAEVRLAIHQRHKLESQAQGCCLLGGGITVPRTQRSTTSIYKQRNNKIHKKPRYKDATLCRYITRPALANASQIQGRIAVSF